MCPLHQREHIRTNQGFIRRKSIALWITSSQRCAKRPAGKSSNCWPNQQKMSQGLHSSDGPPRSPEHWASRLPPRQNISSDLATQD